MRAAPWILLAVLGAILFWSLRSGSAADERARIFKGQADSLQELREVAAAKASKDSVALDSARAESVNREAIANRERQDARRRASLASRTADSARAALAIVLDSLGVSSSALDALMRAHAQEVAAIRAEVEQADSIAATRLSLLQATERALVSLRAEAGALDAENAALRAQIDALNSGRRRDRLGGLGGIVLVGGLLALLR